MTLDEAIKHAEEVANANERLCETVHPAMQLSDYSKCAEEHRQLVEWLKDYKRLKEQEPCEDAINRAKALEAIRKLPHAGWLVSTESVLNVLSELPPVTPQPKTGRWWERDTYPQESRSWDCSECQEIVFEKTNYCPNCGAKMQEVDNGDK